MIIGVILNSHITILKNASIRGKTSGKNESWIPNLVISGTSIMPNFGAIVMLVTRLCW